MKRWWQRLMLKATKPVRRRKVRKEYKRRLEAMVPKEPKDWDEYVDELPVIEI